MKIETVASPLSKALLQGDSQNTDFLAAVSQLYEPGPISPVYPSGLDGVYPQGAWEGGDLVENRVKVLPYAKIGPGSTFNFRVYGWHLTGNPPSILQWTPILLAEIGCTTCDSPGPVPKGAPSSLENVYVDSDYNFCDTLVVNQGSLGLKGYLNTTGPGTNLIAYAVIEIAGAQKISFDFAWTDGVLAGAAMNALWSYC